jgi:hypothetical protein
MISSLHTLAQQIDNEWKAAGYGAGRLPAIAARLLADARPDRVWDLAALAEWTLTQPAFPDACNPFGPLGPPAFTVWSNPHFYVNVYAYTTPEVVIHDHDFSGAFINLSGVTIHCTYEFSGIEAVDDNVQAGALRLRNVEAIGEGSVRQIEPGQGFIHQVWHVSQPTVVLVVRTAALSTIPRQFQYLRPSLATQVFRNDSLSVGLPERFRYTRKMAECLRATTSDGLHYVKTLIQKERPWDAVWHLIENWRFLRGAGALEETIATGAKHQGEWFAGLANAGNDVDLFYSINWPRVVASRDRIVLALLLSLSSRKPILGALAGLLPGTDPHEQLLDSLTRLGADHSIPLDSRPDIRATLAAMLKDEPADDARLEAALRQHALLRPLFTV